MSSLPSCPPSLICMNATDMSPINTLLVIVEQLFFAQTQLQVQVDALKETSLSFYCKSIFILQSHRQIRVHIMNVGVAKRDSLKQYNYSTIIR